MMAKRGRPIKEISQTEFEKLCMLQCTESEISSWFDVNNDTLRKWCQKNYKMNFSDIFSIKRDKGRISLRRSQFHLAEKSAAMAIFLGKQYLGQKDEVKDGSAPDNEIRVVFDFADKPE